ncbi:MAG: cytochrome c oxidase subunit II [Phycisphaerae bacterium]|nr:cytochrome c oxidase subunit II [Phycisphaerae bacterium]
MLRSGNTIRRATKARSIAALVVLAALIVIVPGAHAGSRTEICAPGVLPQSGAGVTGIFGADSPPSESIRTLAWLVLGICAAIFVVVEGLLLVAVVRFRRSSRETRGGRSSAGGESAASNGGETEPAQLYGSNPIELAWTVVPLIIVFVLGLVTIRTIREVQLTEPPEGALRVVVIGHQWWWEYRYPDELGPGREVVTANELVVPTGRPVWLELESADVVHSWWVPRLAGKTDLVPARTNLLWFKAQRPGVFLGQCAEYCGTQHANMLLRVSAVDPELFAAWLEHQATPAVADSSVDAGRNLFLALACMNCHDVDGASVGMFGPNLTHLASRETIGAGVRPLTRDNLRAWIDDPQTIKPGCNMPSLKLDSTQLDLITDYLMTLR